MGRDVCGSCMYYRQHYAFDERRIFRVFCGHCTFSRVKRKHPDAKICENYTPGAPDEAAFVSKEYLSVALLEYMIRLDLLPEIHTGEKCAEQQNKGNR